MCLREFCCCCSPPVEGEGSPDHRPQRNYSSEKLKPEKSLDTPKKTPGVNDSATTGPPPKEKSSNREHKRDTPPKGTPVVSNSIEKVTAAAADEATDGGEHKADTPTPTLKTTSEDVHPGKQLAYHDRARAHPKGDVPKNSSANVSDTTEPQPPTSVE